MGRALSVSVVRGLLDLLASGLGPMDVARATGVSRSAIYRLHHKVGGVHRPLTANYSDRYLNREQRYEIARLVEAGWSIRRIAAHLGRSPSTISRELTRNRCPRSGTYQPEVADRLAWRRQLRPKPTRLSQNDRLRQEVQRLLNQRFSPQQIAGRLRVLHPDDPKMHISHEPIYQALYVRARGEMKRQLQAHLRSKRTTRKPHGRVERRGAIPNAVSIHDRPEEVAGRLVPGHHEGDLIMGSTASNSAVGTIVERTTGYVTLLHLPHGHTAEHVAQAVVEQFQAMPPWFVKTLTWDRGKEMARHETITAKTGVKVYFADPYSPYQRGTNENTNGLLREYLPKGTDLSQYSAEDLQKIADQLNDRPRKRLGYYTPKEALATLLTDQLKTVATTA